MIDTHNNIIINASYMKAVMLEKGWRNKDIIEMTGLDSATIVRMLNGKAKTCNIGALYVLSFAFGVPMEMLIKSKNK